MRRTCERCGTEFDAVRSTRKFCSDDCRKRFHKSPVKVAAARPAARRRVRSRLVTATVAELAAVGRVDSTAGQAALVLARRIDDGGAESGAALAAMVREHAAAMERALREPPKSDPIEAMRAGADQLRRRREQRAAAGGAAGLPARP